MEQVDIAKKLREIVNSDSSTSPPVCLDPRRITVPFERRLVPSHYPDKAPGRARNHFVVYLELGSIVPTTRLLILFLILFVTMTAMCRHRRCARSNRGPNVLHAMMETIIPKRNYTSGTASKVIYVNASRPPR